MYGIGDTCRLDIYGQPVEESTDITQKVNAVIQVFREMFPAPVTALTVSYVGEDYLETMAQMKEWQEVAGNPALWRQYNLEKINFCCLWIIDEAVWKQHVDFEKFGLSFSGMGQIDYRKCIRIMKKCSGKLEHGIVSCMALVSMPKGLSSKNIREIFSGTLFSYGTFLEEPEINEPYTVLVAQGVLRASKGKLFKDMIMLAKELECEEPLRLEMLVFANLGNHRFNGWTICKEKFVGEICIVRDETCKVRTDNNRCYISYSNYGAYNIGIAPRALVSLSSSPQGS